jgi:hypothetical protein
MIAQAACCPCQPCSEYDLFPAAYVIHLAGRYCRCAEAEPECACGCYDASEPNCPDCAALNRSVTVRRVSSDSLCYAHTLAPGSAPCDARRLTLRLVKQEQSGRTWYSACVALAFDDGPPATWYRPAIDDCCNLGTLRRHTGNNRCLWPQSIRVNGTPTPDYCPPQPEWIAGPEDDLNNAPFWPVLDIDLMEDSPEAPIRYFNGELQLRIQDLGSQGFGVPWGHTRIYSNRLENSYDFGNGYNWLVHQWPQLVRRQTDPAEVKQHHPAVDREPTGCTLCVLRGTRNALWFDEFLVNTQPCRTEWRPRFGAKHVLLKREDSFHLVAPNGHQWYFYAFTPNCFESAITFERDARLDGKLIKHIGPGGEDVQLLTAQYRDGRLVEVSRSGEGGSESFCYTYYTSGVNAGRLHYVTHQRDGDIERAEYVYYGPGEPHGNPGDLKLAARQLPTNGRWQNIDVHYCRYHTSPRDTYCQGLLAVYVGPEGFRRLVAGCGEADERKRIATTPLTQLAADDADPLPRDNLTRYADVVAEYDGQRRVETLVLNGGGRRFRYQYQDGWNQIDFNLWRSQTIETRPDGSQRTSYSNFIGQCVLRQLHEGAQHEAFPWATYRIYDQRNGRLLLDAAPSALLGVSPIFPGSLLTAGTQGRSSDRSIFERLAEGHPPGDKTQISGLTVLFRRDGTGLMHVFRHRHFDMLTHVMRMNNAYLPLQGDRPRDEDWDELQTFEYSPHYLNLGSLCEATVPLFPVGLSRRMIARGRAAQTVFTYDWFGGSCSWAGFTASRTAQFSRRTIALPIVKPEENGDGRQHYVREAFNAYGMRQWLADERGVLTCSEFDVPRGSCGRRSPTWRPARRVLLRGSRKAILASASTW